MIFLCLLIRKLLLICAVVILYLPITNGECREVPSQCEWDDEHHYSVCIITKTPSNDIIRRLQLSNYITDRNIDHIHVSVPTEMEDHIDVFWNEEYLMLSVSLFYDNKEVIIMYTALIAVS